MNRPSYQELVDLLKRSHNDLEAVTDRCGCSFPVAMTLVDCENALKAINQAPAKTAKKGLSLVH